MTRDPFLWAILILATALRLYHLGHQSLWLDELMSITSSTGHQQVIEKLLPENRIIAHPPEVTAIRNERPGTSVWRTMDREVHPPLYYLMLRVWRTVAGDGDVAARLLSVLASLIAVLLIYDVGRLLFDVVVARWASLLMAIAPPQIVFAQEVRSYTILVALALGAASALLRLRAHGVSFARVGALCLCSLGLALTHYFSIGALTAFAIYALLAMEPRARRAAFLAWLVAGCIFVVVWGPFILKQGHNTNPGFLNDAGGDHLARTSWRLLTVPGRFLVSSMFAASPRFERFLWLAAPLAFVLPVGFIERRRALLLPFLWLICSLLLLTALDGARDTKLLGLIRYSLIASPPFYLLLSALFSHCGRTARHLLPALATAVALVALPVAYQPFKQDWRRVAQFVGEHVGPGQVVVIPVAVVDGDWWGYAWQLYTAISHYAYSPDRSILILNRPATPALLAQLHDAPGVWLLSYRGVSPAEVLPGCSPGPSVELWPVAVAFPVTINLPAQ
jgi:uncharacterized membrane protein